MSFSAVHRSCPWFFLILLAFVLFWTGNIVLHTFCGEAMRNVAELARAVRAKHRDIFEDSRVLWFASLAFDALALLLLVSSG